LQSYLIAVQQYNALQGIRAAKVSFLNHLSPKTNHRSRWSAPCIP
jgi:hypothetical protein